MKGEVLVLGCGSIGRRHIGNLLRLGVPVTAFDTDPARSEWARRELGCGVVADPRRALDSSPRAVWVCTPPHLHAAGARPALERNVPCFIEKPLAPEWRVARDLSRLAASRRVPAAVGYQLRQHPALRWVKQGLKRGRWGRLLHLRAFLGQHLPDWRPWQDYRKSYTASRAMGGGVLLDCSHELDLARWLAGDVAEVYCRAEKLSDLDIDVEDTAELVLGFRSGAAGSVHLDMTARAPRRGLELTLSEGTVLWDLPSATLRSYSTRTGRWSERTFRLRPHDDLYTRETKAFLAHVRAPRPDGVVTLEDAARTLSLVEAAVRSSRSRRTEKVP